MAFRCPSVLSRCLSLAVVVLLLLFFVLIVRTLTRERLGSDTLAPCTRDDRDFIAVDEGAIDRFRQGLRFATVSSDEGQYDTEALDRIIQFIIRSYPVLHSSSRVKWQRVANYSLLYHIKGENQNLKPYLMMAHLDVVPADADEWDFPPFGADLHDGFIYARGAVDDKHAVFGILEAVEYLLKNKIPQRSFYISFGHDEEVMGSHGAKNVAKLLEDSGVQFEYIIDEGLVVSTKVLSFVAKPTAFIGVSEKGYMTVKLRANVTGGHASVPGRENSIGILANAVSRMLDNPHPSMLGTGPEVGMLENLAAELPFPVQVIVSNLWLFGPIVSRLMSMSPLMSAIIRTTTAVTMFNAGVKDNVLPSSAEAIVNHRIHPSQSVSEVFEYDRRIINDDRIQLETLYSIEPHPVSGFGSDDFGYQTIRSTINQIWGQNGIVILPGLFMASTDTKHFLKLSKNVYRFAPSVLELEDLKRIHGTNERISLQNYEEVPNFYYHLMINSDVERLASDTHDKSSHEDF